MTPNGGNLIIASEDEEALDRLEELIQSLQLRIPHKLRWTVFYLRSADATDVSAMLERLFPTSSVSSIDSGLSGGFLGSLSSGFSSMSNSLLDATGLSGFADPLTLKIIPDVRSNSLFVTGPSDQVNQVEEMLRVLDASELPEQLRDRAPGYIEVQYADVNDVADILRDVYKDYLTASNSGQQQGANPIAMILGGGGRGSSGRGGSRGGNQSQTVRMTLGVDTRTNLLIVSASDDLFRQVEALVTTIDDAADQANETVRIITLENANASLIQQSLASLMPRVKVSTSGSRSSSARSSSARPTGTPGQPGGQPQQGAGPNPDQIRQFFEQRMRERMQQGGSGGGRPGGDRGSFGGGRPGGGDQRGRSDRRGR